MAAREFIIAGQFTIAFCSVSAVTVVVVSLQSLGFLCSYSSNFSFSAVTVASLEFLELIFAIQFTNLESNLVKATNKKVSFFKAVQFIIAFCSFSAVPVVTVVSLQSL